LAIPKYYNLSFLGKFIIFDGALVALQTMPKLQTLVIVIPQIVSFTILIYGLVRYNFVEGVIPKCHLL
jgi:hypothetical protein